MITTILYQLKTGCHCSLLSIKQFFSVKYSWQSIYYHLQKWSKNGSWEKVCSSVFKKHKCFLDLSSIQLDATYILAKCSGVEVSCQVLRKCETTNTLINSYSQGILLAYCNLIAGNLNDACHHVKRFRKVMLTVQLVVILAKGLFLNADSGFDAIEFCSYNYENEIFDNMSQNKRNADSFESNIVFNSLLYRLQFLIGRANAWLDAFKRGMAFFEIKDLRRRSLLLLVFSVILLCKL